jgi:hypothetical protein
LGFVHAVTEHYYLACRRNGPARIALDTLIASAQSSAFVRTLAHIGGYQIPAALHKTGLRDLFAPASKPSARSAARHR